MQGGCGAAGVCENDAGWSASRSVSACEFFIERSQPMLESSLHSSGHFNSAARSSGARRFIDPRMNRRSFLATTGVATVAAATQAQTRDYGKNAPPVRYPDPDIVVIDKRFAKYKVGDTPIQRLFQGTLS